MESVEHYRLIDINKENRKFHILDLFAGTETFIKVIAIYIDYLVAEIA